MNELISVIINVYNGEKYIKKCIDSVINQTYKNLEILIINDGSTDNTLSIINGYKDKRIRVITTENLGLSLSRNIGIDNARGEYLYFIDVDDIIDKDIISYLYKLCKNNKSLLSCCKCLDTYKYDNNVFKDNKKIEILTKEEMLKKVLITRNREVALWNKLIHKSLFKDLRFEDRIINDISLTYKLILKTDMTIYGYSVKYYHYNNEDSISIKKELDYNRNCDRYYANLERYNYIKELYPKLKENDIAMMQIISRLYRLKDKKIKEFLINNKALELYKQLFKMDIFRCNISFLTKIKLLLFRINPKLHNVIVNNYLKIRIW